MGGPKTSKRDARATPPLSGGRPVAPSLSSNAEDEIARLPVHMLETSWRVAVPILLFTLTGYKLDQRFDTLPWLSVAGVLLSISFSSLLVYRYLKANFPEMFGGAR